MQTTSKRRALGRGLGALIPTAPTSEDRPPGVMVAAGAIRPNPWQPRQHFDDAGIEELAASIREKGLLQPLVVRAVGDGYEIIAGERRFRAAQRLGMKQVHVIVREASDHDMLEMALIENLQRQDLNPLEEARAYRRLTDDFGLTQAQIAVRVGKDRSTVANALRLLLLPDEVRAAVESGAISAGHARALAGAGTHQHQVVLARKVVSGKLTVRQTERLAKLQRRPVAIDVDQRAAEEQLTQALGTRVRVQRRSDGSGHIEIQFYSLDGLNALIDRLAAAPSS